MHELPLIYTIAAAFTAAWLLGLLAQRVGLSPIVGYLMAGTLIGPHTPGFSGDLEIAQQLAEVGIILLMFDVGLHFSLKELLSVKGVAIPGALAQSVVASLLGMAIFAALGYPLATGLVLGMALAVASTVVLMRVLLDAHALDTTQGHIAVGWLLVEDVFTVVVLVLIPVLGHDPNAPTESTALWLPLAWALVKLAALVVIALVAGARFVPWVLMRIARLRSRELFTLTVLVFSIAVAAEAYVLFGASMALGAFLAGMVVAQSPVSHQAAADALPMRDTFAVLFFVSVGMLFDPSCLIEQPLMIAAALAIVLLAKPLTALVIVAALGYSARAALTVALGLAQIGEFSFVLSELARHYGLMPDAGQNTLIATAIVSISLNPLLFRSLDKIERRLAAIPWLWNAINARAQWRARRTDEAAERSLAQQTGGEQRLAIVVGYGPVGRAVDVLLREAGLATVIVELNVDTVTELHARNQAAVFGDASQTAILKQAGMDHASHLVVTLPQSRQRATVVAAARYLKPSLRILVRAHYLAERHELQQAGATAAVFEEGEAAVALARLVLTDTGANRELVDRSLRDLRMRLILENVTHLDTRVVRGIMVPWTRVSRLSNADDVDAMRQKVAERRYSRWPVVDAQSAQPVGYLLAKDLIAETATGSDWTRLIRPLRAIGPDDSVETTLLDMQREGATLCIVQDGANPLGLVTIDDILEQVVGRIEDEYPRTTMAVLHEAASRGNVVLELVARDADDAIAELASAIPAALLPADARVAERAIEREHELSTYVGLGVAIPHATCPTLAAPIIVVGRSSRGVTFVDELVHLVFLLVTPEETPELHVPLLSELATIASQPALRQKLLDAATAEQVLATIAEAERTSKRKPTAPST